MTASTHGRVRRPALTREEVLTTALRLIDADGVDGLSMRGIGRALDRDPMRLYRFASSKEELLDGVVELVLGELQIPTEGADWEDVLRDTARRFRDIALTHPHVVPLLVTRPLATPLALRPLGTLRPLEQLLDLHRLPVREFPRIRSLAAELAAYDGLQELEEGLDVVIGGLRRQLDART
jgi:AcrR family transcriptional regulator